MATSVTEYIAYINADEGTTLEAARYPWANVSGSYASQEVTDEGWVITQPASSHASLYRRLVPDDMLPVNMTPVYVARQRSQDRVEVQWEFEGYSGGADAFYLYLSDGLQGVGIVIGAELKVMDIGISTTYLTIDAQFSWQSRHTFHLIKHAAHKWELRVDGATVATWPYALSETTLTVLGIHPALLVFGGTPSAAATSVSTWNAIEWSVNLPLAPAHKVERWRNDLPIRVQKAWSGRWRALAKTFVGMMERSQWTIEALKGEQTSGRVDIEAWSLSGEVLADDEVTPWVVTGSGSQSVVRQRLRMEENAGAAVNISATFTHDQTDAMEVCVEGWFVLRDYTADVDGNTGVSILVDGDDAQVGAYLIETPGEAAGTSWCWALRPTAFGGDLMEVTPLVPVDPYVEHHVKLHILGQTLVLLVVNGRVVAREARSNFVTAGIGVPVVSVYGSWGTGAGATVDVSNLRAVLRASDLTRRPLFEQTVMEALIHIGGCERNDELQVWKENSPGAVSARGTVNGIVTELRHLCCTERVYVIHRSLFGGWIADYTWPDYSPTFLDFPGYFDFVYVEFVWNCPNFTLDALALLIARYYVPLGLLEKRYYVCLIAVATASIAAGSSVSVAVESSRGFEAGDSVTIRDFAGTTTEDAVVSSVPDATTVVLTTVTGTYAHAAATPPIIRKVLRTT